MLEIINKPNPGEAGKTTAIALKRSFRLFRVTRLAVARYTAGREGIVVLVPKSFSFCDAAPPSPGEECPCAICQGQNPCSPSVKEGDQK